MNALLTRWDAQHAARIEVSVQEFDCMEWPKQEIENLGFKLYTSCDPLAYALDLEKTEQEEIDKALLRAIAAGDRYYFIEYGEHGSSFARFCENRPAAGWDSACVGLLVWPRAAWHESYPRRPYVAGCLTPVLDEYADFLTAALNGWLYQYDVFNADGSYEVSGMDFLSEEEALKAAQEEYSEIKYEAEDFEEDTTYKLVSQAA